MTLDDLLDQARIEATLARYGQCLDDDALERWPDFFAERCLYKVTTAENLREGLPIGMMFGDSRAMLVDRVRALRQANIYEPQAYRHVTGRTLVLERAGDTARTETPFLVVRIMQGGESMLFASGRYLDRLRLAGGDAVVIEERIVACDSPRVDTLLAIPL